MRFHGVRTALSRRSGTTLMACRQNENEVSVICTFCFQEYPLISAMASVCETDHAENFWLPPTMTRPKAFFAPFSIYDFTELCGQHKQQFVSVAPAYKQACCSIDIVHLIFALPCLESINLFSSIFYQKNAIGRDKSSTRAQ